MWQKGDQDSDEEPSVTCPRCGMTSHHPVDVRSGYCARCGIYHGPPKEPPMIGDRREAIGRADEFLGRVRLADLDEAAVELDRTGHRDLALAVLDGSGLVAAARRALGRTASAPAPAPVPAPPGKGKGKGGAR